MADEKPLFIPTLVKALKDAGFATKTDVRDIVQNQLTELKAEVQKIVNTTVMEASDAILAGVDAMFADVAKKDDLSKLEAELKTELAHTLSRREFEELKTRMNDKNAN